MAGGHLSCVPHGYGDDDDGSRGRHDTSDIGNEPTAESFVIMINYCAFVYLHYQFDSAHASRSCTVAGTHKTTMTPLPRTDVEDKLYTANVEMFTSRQSTVYRLLRFTSFKSVKRL